MTDHTPLPPVTMPGEEFKALMESMRALTLRVAEVENARAPQEVDDNTTGFKRREVKKRTVSILFVDNKPVVGMKNQGSEQRPQMLIEVVDPKNTSNRYLKADLFVKDIKTGKIETITDVNFVEFTREADRKQCPILEDRRRPWLIEQGVVNRAEVKDYRTVETDTTVPVDIEGISGTLVIEIDGVPVEIHENYVNIAS